MVFLAKNRSFAAVMLCALTHTNHAVAVTLKSNFTQTLNIFTIFAEK